MIIVYNSNSELYILYYKFMKLFLSYDIADFQWITFCHKNRMTMCNNTLACTYNVIDNVRVNNIPRPNGSGDITMSLASVPPSVNIFVSAL